jgi:mannose-1-phosphate guanylyltransferase/phosphomannomutase
LNEVALSEAERHGMLGQLADVVQALRANFGMQVFANGERSIPIDETGFAITGELLLAVLTELALTAQPGGTVVVPVSASGALERIAQNHSGRILRVKANPTALMQACQGGGNVVMGGSAETGFIFPQLHPGFDAMFGIAKIIEWLTVQERSLSQVRLSLPPIYHRSCQVRCPWSLKGALMRHLVEVYGRDRLELLDGVKVFHDSEDWVLVLPDASEPLVRVFANVGESRGAETWVEHNLHEMCSRIEAFCQSQDPLDEEIKGVRESSLA